MSVSYITHRNKQVLLIEYKECKTIADTLIVLDEIKDEFLKTTGIWLTLHDFSSAYGSTEFMNKANQYAKQYFNSRPSKNATFGLKGIKKVLLQGYNLVVKDKIVPFDSMEEALDYLTK
jgi:hypothetical protein